jgi:hypothetical protein
MPTPLDRTSLKFLRDEINVALIAVGEKHGLRIAAGNASYDGSGLLATFKLELAARDETGVAKTREQLNLEKYAVTYGLPADAAGTVFTNPMTKDEWTLVGMKTTRCKAPVLMRKRADHKLYLFTVPQVQKMFADRARVQTLATAMAR